jgi:copper chaperone
MSPRTEHPFLSGNYAPVTDDTTVTDLTRRGGHSFGSLWPLPAADRAEPDRHTYLKGIKTMTLPRQQFAVTGMTCSHCERAVTVEVSRLEGVVSVAVDVSAGTVTIECARWLSYSEVASAIDEAGYEMAA